MFDLTRCIKQMKILIAGDLVPTDSNLNLFEKGDIKSLLGQDLEKI